MKQIGDTAKLRRVLGPPIAAGTLMVTSGPRMGVRRYLVTKVTGREGRTLHCLVVGKPEPGWCGTVIFWRWVRKRG